MEIFFKYYKYQDDTNKGQDGTKQRILYCTSVKVMHVLFVSNGSENQHYKTTFPRYTRCSSIWKFLLNFSLSSLAYLENVNIKRLKFILKGQYLKMGR